MSASEVPRTLFTLGVGEGAEALGAFHNVVGPSEITRLPVGQWLLGAHNTTTVREAFARFALAYDTAGFGDFVPIRGDLPIPEPVPEWRRQVSYDQRQDMFVFTEGAWWLWCDRTDTPQWFILEATAPATVSPRPWAREYGKRFHYTRDLELTQLAVWIIADAAVCLGEHGVDLSAQLYEKANATGVDIDITAHQVAEHVSGAVIATLEIVARQYNWANPHDPDDVRFHVTPHCTAHPRIPGIPRMQVLSDVDR